MDEIMYQKEYIEFKKELDQELNKAADGFVKIGYLLRQAEDTDVLASSGYRNVAEFASIEYGLSKDIVSRYININKRFSEGGYSDRLADRYRGFGMAKLAEMLTLPPAIADAIPDDLSKTEIREIKKEYDAEQEISDIEVAIEAAAVDQDAEEDVLKAVTKQWLHEEPDDFVQLFKTLEQGYDIEKIKDDVAPSGTRVITVRIPGVGKFMMTCKIEENVEIVNMRSLEKWEYSWNEMGNQIGQICAKELSIDTIEDVWKREYAEEFPVREEKQPDPEEKKPEKRKQSKVTVAKSEKKQVNTKSSGRSEQQEKAEVAPVQPVEVLPGVIVEVDIEKATEAARLEERKAEIIAVPEYTEEPDAKENQVNTQHDSDLTDIRSASLDPYIEMMDDAYQMCVRCLRLRDADQAAVQMKRVMSEYEKIIQKIEAKNDEDEETEIVK